MCVYIYIYILPYTYYLNKGIVNKPFEMESRFKGLETEVTSQIQLNYVSDSVCNYLSCCVVNNKLCIKCCTIKAFFKDEFELRL